MAEHVVNLLRRHGFEEIVVTVGFLASTIRTYFGDGSEFGVRLVYATEETPLGTAGSVLNARDELDERFLVISGDVLTDVDLTALVEFHDKQGSVVTLALQGDGEPARVRHRHHRRRRPGRTLPREAGLGRRLQRHHQHGHLRARAGGLRLDPERAGRSTSPSEVFPTMLEAGRPLYGFVAGGYWEDVGTLEAYLRAHADILDGKVADRRARLPARGRASGSGRAPRSTRRPRSSARPSSATTAGSGRTSSCAVTACSVRTSAWATTPSSSGASSTTTSTSPPA